MSKAIKFSLGVQVIFLGCIVLSVVGCNRSRISEIAAATPVLGFINELLPAAWTYEVFWWRGWMV